MGFGYNDFDTGFGMEFQLFNVMFFLIFFLILGMFLFMIVKGLSTWNKNNQSPRLTVDATVVAKRTDVTHHHNGDNMATHSTWYYATFQVESGDRMEFAVDGMEYGMLAEGDMGKLSFQGTRYLTFERERLSD